MRLDSQLVNIGLYESRAKSATAIKSGLVSVNGVTALRPSQNIKESDEVMAQQLPYISGRGALKLIHALDFFEIDPHGLKCLDIGASTGGFTETLLNRGASSVLAVEVGTNQMVAKLKNDSRVTSLENTDFRYLPPTGEIELTVIDVSFISLTEIAPSVVQWRPKTIIALIKPQFEVPHAVASKTDGIIKSEALHQESITKVLKSFAELGFSNHGVTESPIKGGSGNTEFLAMFSV